MGGAVVFKEASRDDVQKLIAQGAQVVDVLEKREYDDAHLPGAIHIPLAKLPERAGELDRTLPVLVYCYDSLCDLSPRAAARLATIGFTDVYDYAASKLDWIGAGMPFEGKRADGPRLATLADPNVPTCRLDETMADVAERIDGWDVCLVIDDRRVVLGLVHSEAAGSEGSRPVIDCMQEAPDTWRPHMTPKELLKQIDEVRSPWVLVTNLDGTLVGVTRPDEVRKQADGSDG
jgi:rhodanese-related sulfurtransferase